MAKEWASLEEGVSRLQRQLRELEQRKAALRLKAEEERLETSNVFEFRCKSSEKDHVFSLNFNEFH